MDKKNKTTLDKLKLMKAAIGIGAILSTSSCGQYQTNENSNNVGITSEQVTEDTTLVDAIETLEPEKETVSKTTTEVADKHSTDDNKELGTIGNEDGKGDVAVSDKKTSDQILLSSDNNYDSSKDETAVVTTKTVSRKDPVVTTKATSKKSSVVTAKATSKNSSVASTKKTTSKTTSVKTEPVTVAPTTPPVIHQPEEYTLDMIKDNPDAFNYFANRMNRDILDGNGYYNQLDEPTFGGKESRMALYLLNQDSISDNVLQEVFKGQSGDDLFYGKEYTYRIAQFQAYFNTRIDYTQYTLDRTTGEYLNGMLYSYFDGTIDDYMADYWAGLDINKVIETFAVAYEQTTFAIAEDYAVNEAVERIRNAIGLEEECSKVYTR